MTTEHTGQVGRPKKQINDSWLQQAVSTKRNLSRKLLAQLLGIHRNTLRHKLQEIGLHRRYSELTDNDIDLILKLYKRLRPESGLRYTTGFLRHHGLKLQRQRVCNSLQQIDGLGQALRRHDGILRRKYQSRCSRSVSHIDGNHKLILWGFVIHGLVDGHDHVVYYIYLFICLSFANLPCF